MKRWALSGVAVVLLGGLFLFEPWTLLQNSTVNDSLPSNPPQADAQYGERAHGAFLSQEHETTGEARVIFLDADTNFVRLEDFATTSGPDLRVWLSEEAAGGNWFKYRKAGHVDLGALKANRGNQNYAVPAGTDLERFQSVVIWCQRFFVAFGSAPITSNAPR